MTDKDTMLMPNYYALLTCILHNISISKALRMQKIQVRETEYKK